MGAGIGMAMAPATEAIMGSLPKAEAGVGSAMNDVVREVAGTLGIAVLGSVLASAYARAWTAPLRLPAEAATAASDSVGAAHAVAGQLGGSAGAASSPPPTRRSSTPWPRPPSIAAAIALAGALIAPRSYPPAHASESTDVPQRTPRPLPNTRAVPEAT